VWKIGLESIGEFLQKSWADNVIAPTKGLSEVEQLHLLYGPQGKVREFVNQFMKPFLVDNESRLGRVLDEELPLSPALFKALRDEKQLVPILEKGEYLVRIAATLVEIVQPEAQFALGTEFRLECEKPVKVCYPPKDGCDSSATLTWSPRRCKDTTIVILVSCDRHCVGRATPVGIVVTEDAVQSLYIRYPGQSGFLDFMKAFSTGRSPEFGSSHFASAVGPADRPKVEKVLREYHINKIKIAYDVSMLSSGLDKLLTPPAPVVPLTITR
jgi:hypothetical protein